MMGRDTKNKRFCLSFYFYPLLFFSFFSCFNSISKSARKVSPKTQHLTQDSDTTRSKKEILILSVCLDWRLLYFSFCVFLFVFFFFSRVFSSLVATVYVRYMNSSHNFWPVFHISVYYLQTHKFHFLSIFSLKMGLTVLFTRLKIILIQWFQQ